MPETSGTDHCQEEDTGLGMGTVKEVMMFFKEQKEVAIENFWGFFFFLFKCVRFVLFHWHFF